MSKFLRKPSTTPVAIERILLNRLNAAVEPAEASDAPAGQEALRRAVTHRARLPRGRYESLEQLYEVLGPVEYAQATAAVASMSASERVHVYLRTVASFDELARFGGDLPNFRSRADAFFAAREKPGGPIPTDSELSELIGRDLHERLERAFWLPAADEDALVSLGLRLNGEEPVRRIPPALEARGWKLAGSNTVGSRPIDLGEVSSLSSDLAALDAVRRAPNIARARALLSIRSEALSAVELRSLIDYVAPAIGLLLDTGERPDGGRIARTADGITVSLPSGALPSFPERTVPMIAGILHVLGRSMRTGPPPMLNRFPSLVVEGPDGTFAVTLPAAAHRGSGVPALNDDGVPRPSSQTLGEALMWLTRSAEFGLRHHFEPSVVDSFLGTSDGRIPIGSDLRTRVTGTIEDFPSREDIGLFEPVLVVGEPPEADGDGGGGEGEGEGEGGGGEGGGGGLGCGLVLVGPTSLCAGETATYEATAETPGTFRFDVIGGLSVASATVVGPQAARVEVLATAIGRARVIVVLTLADGTRCDEFVDVVAEGVGLVPEDRVSFAASPDAPYLPFTQAPVLLPASRRAAVPVQRLPGEPVSDEHDYVVSVRLRGEDPTKRIAAAWWWPADGVAPPRPSASIAAGVVPGRLGAALRDELRAAGVDLSGMATAVAPNEEGPLRIHDGGRVFGIYDGEVHDLTVAVGADGRLSASIRLRGIRDHRTHVSAVNGIGVAGTTTVMLRLVNGPMEAAAASLRQARATAFAAEKARLADVHGRYFGQGATASLDGLESALSSSLVQTNADLRAATAAYRRARATSEAQPTCTATFDISPDAPAPGSQAYRLVGFAETDNERARIGAKELAMVPIGADPLRRISRRRIVFVTAGPYRFLVDRSGPFSGTTPRTEVMEVGDRADLAIDFARCAGRALATNVRLIEAPPIGLIPHRFGEPSGTGQASARVAIDGPSQGPPATVTWELLKAPRATPPVQVSIRAAERGARVTLRTGTPGHYVLRGAAVISSSSRGSATEVLVTMDMLGVEADLRVANEVLDETPEIEARIALPTTGGRERAHADLRFAADRVHGLRLDKSDFDTTWRWSGGRGIVSVDHDTSVTSRGTAASSAFSFDSRGADVELRARVEALTARGAPLDAAVLAPVVFRAALIPGEPARLVLTGSRRGRSATINLVPLSGGDPVAVETLAVAAFPDVLRPSVSAQDRIDLTLLVLDADGREVRDGTPVGWRLIGGGALSPVVGEPGRRTAQGMSKMRLDASFDPATQLVEIECGRIHRVFGAASRAIEFSFALRNAAVDPTTGRELINRTPDPEDPLGATVTRLEVTPTLDGQALPDGTEVHWIISQGSMWDPEQKSWCPATKSTVRGGVSRVSVSAHFHAPDGERNYLRLPASGAVTAVASIGSGQGRFDTEFTLLPVRRRPRLEFRFADFVRQSDLRWVELPSQGVGSGTTYADNLLTVNSKAGGHLHVELRERRAWRPLAVFPFDGTRFDPRVGVFTSLPQPDYAPDLQLTLRSPSVGDVPFTFAAPGAHTRINSFVLSPVELEGDPIVGLSSWEAEFDLRLSSQLSLLPYTEFTLLAGRGAVPAGFRPGGEWTFGIDAEALGADELVFRFRASGCADRAALDLEARVARDLIGAGWTRIRLRALGRPVGTDTEPSGAVTIELQVADRVAADTGRPFNWIPGDGMIVSLFGSRVAAYDVRDLVVRTELNENFNFNRSAAAGGRAPSPWVSKRLRPTETELALAIGRRAGRMPVFTRPVARAAELHAEYCDDGSSGLRYDIAAVSASGLRGLDGAARFVSGFAFGEETSMVGIAGDMAAGFLFWGDIRDIGKNLVYAAAPGGKDASWLDFSLAVLGLIADVGEIFSGGTAAPANAAVAVLRPTLKQLKRLESVSDRLKYLVRNIGAVLADELRVLFIRYRLQRNADIAQVALVSGTLFDALFRYLFKDVSSAQWQELGRLGERATFALSAVAPAVVPPAFASWLAPVAATRIDWSSSESSLADELATLGDVAASVQRRFEDLAAFFNMRISNAHQFRELLEWLGAIPLPAGRLRELQDQWIDRLFGGTLGPLDPNVATTIRRRQFDWAGNHARAGLTPNQMAEVVLMMTRRFEDPFFPQGLEALAGHTLYLGPSRSAELISRLVGAPGAGGRDLLDETLDRMLDVFQAAHRGTDTVDEASEAVYRFLRPLSGGSLYVGTTQKPVRGTLFEMAKVSEYFRALGSMRQNRNLIRIAPGEGMLEADLVLELLDEVLSLKPGRWVAECKAWYPRPRFLEEMRGSLTRQFTRRIAQVFREGNPYDFVYFFRGPPVPELIADLRHLVEDLSHADGLYSRWLVTVDGQRLAGTASESAGSGRDTLRLVIEHDRVPVPQEGLFAPPLRTSGALAGLRDG